MVSEGKVNNDLNTLASLFSNYNSIFNSLSLSWSGTSYQKLVGQAQEFSDEFYGGLKRQMEEFTTACSLYSRYDVAKRNHKIALDNYNEAVSRGDSSKASEFKSQANTFESNMNDYKRQIESALLTASSIKLDAVNYYGNDGVIPTKPSTPKTTPKTSSAITPKTSPKTSPATSPSNDVQKVIQAAINFGVSIANDNRHGYSRDNRMGNPDYDCSSLVIACFDAAGVPVKKNGACYTGNMRTTFLKSGFIWIPGDPKLSDLQPGDVVIKEGKHTELYIGNGMNVAAHSNKDGRAGDSSGKEIDVCKYRDFPWDGVLRYVGK